METKLPSCSSTFVSNNLRIKQMEKIQNESLELFKKKNEDYGDSFATYGVVGVLVRLGDKISRLTNIHNRGVTLVDDETLRDTLIDLHNYSAMAVMLMDEVKSNIYTINSFDLEPNSETTDENPSLP
jgi:hypothetical protein